MYMHTTAMLPRLFHHSDNPYADEEDSSNSRNERDHEKLDEEMRRTKRTRRTRRTRRGMREMTRRVLMMQSGQISGYSKSSSTFFSAWPSQPLKSSVLQGPLPIPTQTAIMTNSPITPQF